MESHLPRRFIIYSYWCVLLLGALFLFTSVSLHEVEAHAPTGGDVVPVSEGSALFGTASADGRYAIYAETVEPGTAYTLLRRDMRTGEVVTLRPDNGTLTNLYGAWLSPDGQTILYLTNAGMEAIAFDGGQSTLIPEVPYSENCPYTVQFDPASRYAIVSSAPLCADGPLRLVRVALDTRSAIVIADDLLNLTTLEIRDDGDYLLFTANRFEDAHYFLAIVPHDANTPTFIPSTARDALPLKFATFAADGAVVYQPVSDTGATEVYRLDLPDTTPRLVGTMQKAGYRYTVNPTHRFITYAVSDEVTPTHQFIRRFYFDSGIEETFGEIADGFMGIATYPFTTNDFVFSVNRTECPYTCDEYDSLYHLSANGTVRQLVPEGEYVPASLYSNATRRYLLFYRAGQLSQYDSRTGEQTSLHVGWDDTLFAGERRVYLKQGDTGLVSADIRAATPPVLLTDQLQTIHGGFGGDILYFSTRDGRIYMAGNPAPTVTFNTPTSLTAEGTIVSVTVSLESTPLHTVTVDYALINGTATEGQDFTFNPGTFTFAPFERTKTFTVELADDGVTESVETAIFILSNITGGTAGDQTTYTLRIADEVYEQRLPILQR